MNNMIALRYAESLFELAMEEKQVDQYANDLSIIDKVMDKEIIDFFHHPLIAMEDKEALMDQTFKGNVGPYVLNFLKLLLNKRRFNEITTIIQEFKRLQDQHLGIQRGFLYSASPMSEEEVVSIENAMSKKENTTIKLELVIDSSLIGGIKVVIDDHVVDGSIQNRLSNLKKDLLKGKVGE